MKNQRVIVPGFSNQMLVAFAKLMPRSLSLEIVRRYQKPKDASTEEASTS
jgi:short-subunit dehydrogenase